MMAQAISDLEYKIREQQSQISRLTTDLISANNTIERSQSKIEILLEATEQIAAVRDKFLAIVQASNSILHEIPVQEVIEVEMYFYERESSGGGGYAFFGVKTDRIDNGPAQVRLDSVADIRHDFYRTLPDPIPQILETYGSNRCSLVDEVLWVPLSHGETLLGVISIKGIDRQLITEDDKHSVDTVSQFLSVSLENLGFTLELEQKIRERTKQLNSSLAELEQKNTTLAASYQKLEDLNHTNHQLLQKLGALHEVHLKSLGSWLDNLLKSLNPSDQKLAQDTLREIHHIEEMLQPIASLYFSEKAIKNKHVLLAEANKKQQIIAKMALGGTGVTLDIAETLEQGQELLDQQAYDILFVDSEFIELTAHAYQKYPKIQSVFMTQDEPSHYIQILKDYPFLGNIVSRNPEDRTFTLKNILTTVSKLTSQNIFGLEKYLSWGVDIHRHAVTCSQTRGELVDAMEADFKLLGIRRNMLTRCKMVAEELLMNAIYDAPVDVHGKQLYNHLPRTTPVQLDGEQSGTFRYACDGLLLAIAVEDPFGALDRETILTYIMECYSGGQTRMKQEGGAGLGLFQIMEMSDLLVINVKPRLKTEVIALFNIDPNKPKTNSNKSLHYFYG